jgi:hypothetical protein
MGMYLFYLTHEGSGKYYNWYKRKSRKQTYLQIGNTKMSKNIG